MKHFKQKHDRYIYRMCTAKFGYETAKQAARAIKRQRKRRDLYPELVNLRAYECPVCGLFHLTKRKKSQTVTTVG